MCTYVRVAYEYKLIAGILSELLNIFKMLELTMRVSEIICVLAAYFIPTKTIICV